MPANARLLDHYNEELRYLRSEGARFAEQNPQVASQLGLHPGAVADPFVERLLEGVAFLSARIHARMDREYAEFSRQALSRLAPGFSAATPSITSFSFSPDLTSPESHRGKLIPRGSAVLARVPGRLRPVQFTTGRDVMLLPLKIAHAQCSRALQRAPAMAATLLAKVPAVISLRFEIEGNATLSDLLRSMAQVPGGPDAGLTITLGADAALAFDLHRALLAQTTQWLALLDDGATMHVVDLPLDDLRMAGGDETEALLPSDLGGFAGHRLLREYFALPARFLGMELHGLSRLATRCPQARSFELVFALKKQPATLLDRISAKHFHLFATPAINLYEKRLDPLPYSPDVGASWIPVDRNRPSDHHLFSLTEVCAINARGRNVALSPVMGRATYDGDGQAAGHYSLLRSAEGDDAYTADGVLYSHDRLQLSLPGAVPALQDIRAVQMKGLVVDRGWSPEALLEADFSLSDPMGVHRIDCLWLPSRPRPMPRTTRYWEAASFMGETPLSMRSTDPDVVKDGLLRWMALAALPDDDLDQRRLASLISASHTTAFSPCKSAVPMGWVRSTRLGLDIASSGHADNGAWLFGRVLAQALSQGIPLNDGFEVDLCVDGQPVSTHGNLRRPDGSFA